MANKYIYAMQPIYETIQNLVNVKTLPKEIADICVGKNYRMEIILNDTSQKDLHKVYELLAEMCWFNTYNNYDYIGE